MLHLCNCRTWKSLLLIVCVQVCACVYLNIEKTVTFEIPKQEPEEEHMVFATIGIDGDGPRNLKSVCSNRGCNMRITEKQDATTRTLSVSVVAYWFWSGEPWLYGHLSICWGAKNIFRQFPITRPKLNCKQLTTKDEIVQPEAAAMDPLSIGMYTWFMGRENYDELRFSGSTDLLLPLHPEPYQLPVYLMLFHQSTRKEVECKLQRPYISSPTPMKIAKSGNQVWHYTKHLTKLMFLVESEPEKSGTYTVSCQGKYYYRPESAWFPLHVEKEITLRFEKVARIELVGHTGNTVFFPHSNETGEFHVNVYSTSDVVAFHITRSDGLESKAAGEILTEFLSHPYYLLMAKYRVSLPWMDNSITGLYTITISNKEGQSAMLGIRLHKLEELVVLVNPMKLETEEASSVSFQCLVLTDMPANTTIKWEYEPPPQEESIVSKESSMSGNRRAVELTLHSPALSQSGFYTCVADNGFQRVKETVLLSVFPPGVHNYKPQPKASWIQRMSSDNVLDIDTLNSMKIAAQVAGIVLITVLAAIAAAVGGLVCWRVSRWLQQKQQSVSESKTHPDVDSNLEVINMVETQPLLESSKKKSKDARQGVAANPSELQLDEEQSQTQKTNAKRKEKGKKKTTPAKSTEAQRKSETRGKSVQNPTTSSSAKNSAGKKKQKTPPKLDKKGRSN